MKKFLVFISFLFIGSSTLRAQSFQQFIDHLNAIPQIERQAVVDSFMAVPRIYPFVEYDTLAHGIFKGAATSVTIAGDPNNWDPAANPMIHVAGTDFWYLDLVFPADARLDYKFVLNGSNWILDPLNPKTCNGGYGPNSELSMPLYEPAPEIQYYPDIPHGTLHDTLFHSTFLNNNRTVRVYLPPGYSASDQQYGMVLFHDGLEYISLGQANNVLDYLIDQQIIAPVIGVFVPPVNREAEYQGNLMGSFTSFIVDEVIPWIDGKYRTRQDPAYRAVVGASSGGNITLWLGMTHPEIFGKLAPQSAYIQPSIKSTFETGPPLPLEFYLDIGTYDIPLLIPLVRDFETVLQAGNYNFLYYEFNEGHSWGNWRAHIDIALEYFFPLESGINDGKPAGGFYLGLCYPNPVNQSAVFQFKAPAGSLVTLSLFDIHGLLVDKLWEGRVSQENNRVTADLFKLKPGVYYYSMVGEGYSETRKLLIIR